MKIFISHSSTDASFVDALVSLLRQALLLSAREIRCTSVEATELAPGTEIERQLRDDILACSVFIAVLSPASTTSTYVLFELGAAWGANKKMCPILVPGMVSAHLEGPLKNLQITESDRAGLIKLLEKTAGILDTKLESTDTILEALETVLKIKPDLEPMAYAVLSYVVDRSYNFALLKDRHYRKIQPPGRRLRNREQPHEVAHLMASSELDLDFHELVPFPPHSGLRKSSVRVVPRPYQVQVERNPHRQALAHYDFVYVFTVEGERPSVTVQSSAEHKYEPAWYSIEEVESRENDESWGPHEDMVETMKRIVEDLKHAAGII